MRYLVMRCTACCLTIWLFSAFVALSAAPAYAQTDVPSNWPLIPSGLNAGDEFRLLFMGRNPRNADSTDIAVYDAYVQGRIAANGHTEIKAYSSHFKVLGSTATVNARTHTGTTSTGGVPVYWLNGPKVADNYADFYDGSWDDKDGATLEDGTSLTSGRKDQFICTGTNDDGTTASQPLGATTCAGTKINISGNTLSGTTGANSAASRYLALSGVFRVGNFTATTPAIESVRVTSDPGNDGEYVKDDAIKVTVTLSEAVAVTGTPKIKLRLAEGATPVKPRYAAAESTATALVFSYTVKATDYSHEGVIFPRNGIVLGNGGSIKNQAGTVNADLDYAKKDLGNHKVHVRPVVTSVTMASTPAANGSYRTGETIEIDLTFDKEVRVFTDFGTPEVWFVMDGSSPARREAAYATTVGDNVVRFEYEVQAGDLDEDGILFMNNAIVWNDGAIIRKVHGDVDDLDELKILRVAGNGGTTYTYGLHGHRVNTTVSTDATLYDLLLDDGNGADTPMNPAFALTTTSYTASVINSVDEITVLPTVNESNATVAYLNASDTALTDADLAKDGFQAPLLVGANTIKVKVTAEDDSTTETYTVVVTRAALVPGQVTGVRITPGTGRLTVAWDTATDADGYKVQWKSGAETFADAATAGREATVSSGSTTSHTITGLTNGTAYDVQVIATRTNADDETPSAPASGTPVAVPGQVTGVRITPGTGRLTVAWDTATDADVYTDADGYKVQWKSGAETFADAATAGREATVSSGSTTSHTITGLTNGTAYDVQVIATRTNAEDGTPSAPASGTPSPRARITGVAFTNVPSNDTYGLGDTIEVSITFNNAVEVTGSPRVQMYFIDAHKFYEFANYAAASSTNRVLVFKRLVTGDDDNESAVRVIPDGLKLNGGTIRIKGTTVNADIAHAGTQTDPDIDTRWLEGIAVTSAPAVPETVTGNPVYGPGEKIQFTVTFKNAVDVDQTDGALKLKFRSGSARATYAADYESGTGTKYLVFAWTVPANIPDDGAGLVVRANYHGHHGHGAHTTDGLVLDGGTIESRGGFALNIRHGQHDTDSQVDTTAPVLAAGADGATIDGTALALKFQNPDAANSPDHLDEASAPAPADFAVTVAGSPRTVSSVNVNGAAVTLTLASPVAHAQTVTVGYTPGTSKIRDRWGNEAAQIAGRPVRADSMEPGPAMPLAASFVSVPAEHDGETAFWLELSFDAAVVQGSKSHIRALLGVAGGSETRMRRKGNRLDHWRIRIEPSSHEAVTVTLSPSPACGAAGAVCTEDGRTFTTALATRIQGPPGLAVADAEVEEAANATLAFAVTLSRAASGSVTVDYATSDGSATAGSDYTAASGTLTFAAGETGKTIPVPVLDDAHNEGSETLTLTLSNPSGAYLADGTATGTITNTDEMPQAWIARFGRTVAEQVLDAVESRMTAARAPGVEVSLAGQRVGGGPAAEVDEAREAGAGLKTLAEWVRGEGGEETATGLQSRTVTGLDFLTGSSFALTGGSREMGFTSLWGRGAISSFDGREGKLTLDGEVQSAMVGTDWVLDAATAGVMVSRSRGEGGYRSPGGSGEVESTLTGLYPYGHYAVSERLSVWGVVGYGKGSLTLTPEGQAPMETDMDLTLAGAGLRSVMVAAPAEGGLELAANPDGFVVRTSSDRARGLAGANAEVTRVRLGLEGTWRGGPLVPSMEIGARHDGGDAETGFGMDIGAGLAWSNAASGIAVEVRGRGLLTHVEGDFRERGFAGSLNWDPAPSSARGPTLTLSQTLGAQASGGLDSLLSRPTMAGLAANDDEDAPQSRRLDARLGYGFPLLGDRLIGTPELGLGLSDTGRDYSLGWRLAPARSQRAGFDLRLEGTRREAANDDRAPEHELRLRGALRW